MSRWRTARDAAWTGVALVLIVVLGQVSEYLRFCQVESQVGVAQKDVLVRSLAQSVGRLNAGLRRADLVLGEVHKAERDYYWDAKAAMESSATAARSADRLINNLDGALAVLTTDADKAVHVLTSDAQTVLRHSNDTLYKADLALQASRGAAEAAEKQILNLSPAVKNLNSTSESLRVWFEPLGRAKRTKFQRWILGVQEEKKP